MEQSRTSMSLGWAGPRSRSPSGRMGLGSGRSQPCRPRPCRLIGCCRAATRPQDRLPRRRRRRCRRCRRFRRRQSRPSLMGRSGMRRSHRLSRRCRRRCRRCRRPRRRRRRSVRSHRRELVVEVEDAVVVVVEVGVVADAVLVEVVLLSRVEWAPVVAVQPAMSLSSSASSMT